MKYEGFLFKIKPKQPLFNKYYKKYKDLVVNKKEKDSKKEKNSQDNSKKIFVVHGHNEKVKGEVVSFLKGLNLMPITLDEQSNNGMTIIEKLEGHSEVNFAIILMTDDDVGKPSGHKKLKKRARQNVIFEHGYFTGKLSRKKVCVLYMEGVELPSDLSGVVYISYDVDNLWREKLIKEIKSSGISTE
jgi:predicted nucleotide-binding protein